MLEFIPRLTPGGLPNLVSSRSDLFLARIRRSCVLCSLSFHKVQIVAGHPQPNRGSVRQTRPGEQWVQHPMTRTQYCLIIFGRPHPQLGVRSQTASGFPGFSKLPKGLEVHSLFRSLSANSILVVWKGHTLSLGNPKSDLQRVKVRGSLPGRKQMNWLCSLITIIPISFTNP